MSSLTLWDFFLFKVYRCKSKGFEVLCVLERYQVVSSMMWRLELNILGKMAKWKRKRSSFIVFLVIIMSFHCITYDHEGFFI